MVKDGLSRCFVKQTDVNLQIQYPKNVRNIFYICSAEFRHTYYDESVPLLSLIGNLVNFKVDRVSNRHSSLGVSYTIHKYIAAGVGYCLLSTGLPEPPIDKAINLTLSLSTHNCSCGWERTKPKTVMELHSFDYQSPESEILEMQSEGLLCGSNEIVDENEGIW